jgi:hypothetical protein
MSILQPFLAQNLLPTDVIPETWHWMGLTLKELVTVFGSVAIVTLLLFLWAAYLRKGPRRHSHHHHHHHYSRPVASATEATGETDAQADGEKRYRRKRRRRREHRPRNPTLAETGGLPPVRSDHQQDPLP